MLMLLFCAAYFTFFKPVAVFLDFKKEEKSYQVISWLAPEDHQREFKKSFDFFLEETLGGR